MEVSKLKANGELKIPKSILKKMEIQEGDPIGFIELDNGTILLATQDQIAYKTLQNEFGTAANERGITEEDILNDLEQIREVLWNERQR